MTASKGFGTGKREGHDSSEFYKSLGIEVPDMKGVDRRLNDQRVINRIFAVSSEHMTDHVAPNSVGLIFTSPPYHAGKDYDTDETFEEYLEMLGRVWVESYLILEPGAKIVVNVANLGRSPYVDLRGAVARQLIETGFFGRGEIIWKKGEGASGSCAWGSWRSPSNPTLRDLHEYLLVFSKPPWKRVRTGEATISRDDFLRDTLSVWNVAPESAKRVGHPAPFPVELARRVINLFTFQYDLVVDPFIGSGTVGVAAEELERRWIGFETNPEYALAASKRILDRRA